MARFFPGASISKIHGQPTQVGRRLIVPMFHPAAALHQPRYRSLIVEDFNKLPQFIAQAARFSQAKGPSPDNAEQLSLF
jgi:DNA polymerase